MRLAVIAWAAAALALGLALPWGSGARADQPDPGIAAEPLADAAAQSPASADVLRVPDGYTREQLVFGKRIFNGEAAGGKCIMAGSDLSEPAQT